MNLKKKKRLALREMYKMGMFVEEELQIIGSFGAEVARNNPFFLWDPKWTEVLGPAVLLRIPWK